MKHSQVLLGMTLKTIECTWTLISLAYTGSHPDTPRSHVQIWFTRPSPTLSPRLSGTKLATFWARDYDEMYQMSNPATIMKNPFSLPNNSANSRDILRNWVKEPTRFRLTPDQIYKMKILRKAYQYLVIFACRLSGQACTETFHQIWVIALDPLTRQGRPYNWSDILAHQLKEQITKAR